MYRKIFKSLRNARFLYKMLIIVLTAAVIPLLIFDIVGVGQLRRELYGNAINQTRTTLTQTTSVMSQSFQQMRATLVFLVTDKDVRRSMINSTRNMGIEEKEDFLDRLKEMADNAQYAYRVCLVDFASGRLVASNYGYTTLENERFAWLAKEIRNSKVLPNYNLSPTRLINESIDKSYISNSKAYSCMSFPLINTDGREIYAVLIVDMNRLFNRFVQVANLSDYSGEYMMVSDDGIVMYHPDMERVGKSLDEAMFSDVKREGISQHGDSLILSQRVGEANLYAVAQISMNKLYAHVNLIQRNVLLLLGVLCLLATGFAVISSRTLYKPMKNILHKIETLESVMGNRNQDEFKYIGEAFEHILKRYGEVNTMLEHTQSDLDRAMLYQLLKSPAPIMQERLTDLEDNTKYAIMLLDLGSIGETGLLRSLLSADGGSPFAGGQALCFGDEAGLLLVIRFNEDISDNQLLDNIASLHATKVLPEDALIALTFQLYPRAMLHTAYQRVLFTCNIARTSRLEGLVCFETLESYFPGFIQESTTTLKELFNIKNTNDEKSYRTLLDNYLRPGIPGYECNIRMVYWLLAVIKTMPGMMDDYISEYNEYCAGEHINQAGEMKRFLLRAFHSTNTVSGEEEKAAFKQALDSYIADNYDRMIGLSDAVSALGMNIKNFYSMIKQATGMTFVDYLNNYRIEKAKALLCLPKTSINDAGRSVGFSSNSYFIHVFKTMTSLTPGEYRRLMIEKNEQAG